MVVALKVKPKVIPLFKHPGTKAPAWRYCTEFWAIGLVVVLFEGLAVISKVFAIATHIAYVGGQVELQTNLRMTMHAHTHQRKQDT